MTPQIPGYPDSVNPLLKIQFQIPFDKIQPEHVGPAVEHWLNEAKAAINALAADPSPRTYDNTLGILDLCTEPLEWTMNVVRHLESVATTPALREAHNAVQPLVSAFYSSLPLNEGLWKAIQAFAETDEAKGLSGPRARFLKKTIDDFRRHGAELDPAGKARLQDIDVELSKVTTKFSENVLDSTNEYELVITDEGQLSGLPPTPIAAAKASALAKGKVGWRFTLQAPSYIPVMTYVYDTGIREQMWRAFNTRAASGSHDNRPLILRILELRREKAKLLGFADFSDLVLHDRMAHSGASALAFLEDLRTKTQTRFESENRELLDFAGRPEFAPWDIAYFAEKQRLALYDFDEEALRPYFPMSKVVAGMFEIFGRVFSLRIEQGEAPGWDPEVRFYKIFDSHSGSWLGGFYADWYPRENKRGGAWMDALITGKPGEEAHLGLICGNLTPPVDGKEALLTHREVETIFHEFGHLLHHCLSRVPVRSLAGTNVAWDFVELPSQIMENWCWERESLDLFARHHETGAAIPEELFQKMRRARTFRAANNQMRQVGFGYVDLLLHRVYDPAQHGDVLDYARSVMQTFAPAAYPKEFAMIASFTHLFASPVGYGAGYYSYKWAEVLDADAFSRFLKDGVFSSEVGGEFRERILAKGDSEDPAALYRDFMGRDPDPNALLERAGLL